MFFFSLQISLSKLYSGIDSTFIFIFAICPLVFKNLVNSNKDFPKMIVFF